MEIEVKREPSTQSCTISEVYVDGVFACFGLEDVVREIPDKPVSEWKIKGETAIPCGRYKVIVTYSNRFKRELPLLLKVEGFEGIRIHPGNTHENTEGCLLVGTGRNSECITDSRTAFNELMNDILFALDNGEEVWITVG